VKAIVRRMFLQKGGLVRICLCLLALVLVLLLVVDHMGIKYIKSSADKLTRSLIENYETEKKTTSLMFDDDNKMTRDCLSWKPLASRGQNSNEASEWDVWSKNLNPAAIVTESPQNRKESFAKIWSDNVWGKQSKSGPGSLLSTTVNIRKVLKSVIAKIKAVLHKKSVTMLDSSCGDMTWMPTFLAKRKDIDYTGYDIVPGNINGHKQKFSLLPWNFEVHDLVVDPVPYYDVIFSRVTLQHLKTGDIQKVLRNFLESGSRFLLTTNFPSLKLNRELDEAEQYRFRPVNLLLAPFSLPAPICTSIDLADEAVYISLWDLDLIRTLRARGDSDSILCDQTLCQ